ncbi:hypothetical protein H257_01705 [Aphanomyces astaci]|uniref:Uncharacterized protein n=1 Tax=Aphanomyces astaci TaxID=112090 RepID=W4H3E7_APHAT|nr:hypothetical protein H257_01705 [Aphanomyces astaci]ETV86535.1 hypothetical protein H257_01705 [Aphanomyces astaci]|eukprot:XP_009823334.1 hypothetical protein H257_01705 [Aphanomyces astaci]
MRVNVVAMFAAVAVALAANDTTIITVEPSNTTTTLAPPSSTSTTSDPTTTTTLSPPSPTTTTADTSDPTTTTTLSPPSSTTITADTSDLPAPPNPTSVVPTTTTSPTTSPTTTNTTPPLLSIPTEASKIVTDEPTSSMPTTSTTTRKPSSLALGTATQLIYEAQVTPRPSASTTASKATLVTTVAPQPAVTPAESKTPSMLKSNTTLGLLGGGLLLFVAVVIFIFVSVRRKLRVLSVQADAEYANVPSPLPPPRHSSVTVSSAYGIARAASHDHIGSWRGSSFSQVYENPSSIDTRSPSMRSVHAYLGSGAVRYSGEYGGLATPHAVRQGGSRSFQFFDPHTLAIHGRATSFSDHAPMSSGRRLSGDLGMPSRRSNDWRDFVDATYTSSIPRTTSAPMALSSMPGAATPHTPIGTWSRTDSGGADDDDGSFYDF